MCFLSVNVLFAYILFFQESDIEPRRSTIKLPVRVKIIPTPPRRYVEVYIAKPNHFSSYVEFQLECS